MEKILCEILSEFKKAEYKIHVLHTSLQWPDFLSLHPFLGDIYSFIADQQDAIMEDMEQLGYDVPVNLSEIIKEDEENDRDSVIELTKQEPNIQEQLKLTENTLMTLIGILQEGIMISWSENDYVIQNNLIDYQKTLRVFQRKIRRTMGEK